MNKPAVAGSIPAGTEISGETVRPG